MANSLPIIATTVGSIPYYLQDHKNALLIRPKSPNDIAKAVKAILKDRDLRKRLIKEGRILAQENTLEIQAKRILAILRNSDKNIVDPF